MSVGDDEIAGATYSSLSPLSAGRLLPNGTEAQAGDGSEAQAGDGSEAQAGAVGEAQADA
jgi:hypothetical protein